MKQKVLTVDDSRTMRTMLCHYLAEAGYEVVAAEDGAPHSANRLIARRQRDGAGSSVGSSCCRCVRATSQPVASWSG